MPCHPTCTCDASPLSHDKSIITLVDRSTRYFPQNCLVRAFGSNALVTRRARKEGNNKAQVAGSCKGMFCAASTCLYTFNQLINKALHVKQSTCHFMTQSLTFYLHRQRAPGVRATSPYDQSDLQLPMHTLQVHAARLCIQYKEPDTVLLQRPGTQHCSRWV